jgi:hypothetical protein
MTTNANTNKLTEPVATERIWWVGLLLVAAATLVNGLVQAAALALLPVDPGFMPLQSPVYVPFTIVGAGAGVLTYAALVRFTRRPITTFRIVALVVLVLSYLPDLGLFSMMPGATAGTVGALMLMHTLTAAIVVGGLTTFTRRA